MIQGNVGFGGSLAARKFAAAGPGLAWKLRNMLRWGYIWGWLANNMARMFSKVTGIPTIIGELRARKFDKAAGRWVDYGVLGRRVVTSAGVAHMVDAWTNTVELEALNYHGCGTGNTAENASDTGLITEITTALNPDSTRATGTQTQPSANILQSVGTLTFDDAAAVVEHGLFSQAATGGGTLWDRTVFAAINVASGDSIQFTYQCTLTAGS
jgi:hypothetical protein